MSNSTLPPTSFFTYTNFVTLTSHLISSCFLNFSCFISSASKQLSMYGRQFINISVRQIIRETLHFLIIKETEIHRVVHRKHVLVSVPGLISKPKLFTPPHPSGACGQVGLMLCVVISASGSFCPCRYINKKR